MAYFIKYKSLKRFFVHKKDKKIISLLIFLLAFTIQSRAKGNLKYYKGQELMLMGFNNLKLEKLNVISVDSLGGFTLIYPSDYRGIGILKAEEASSLVFVLPGYTNLKITSTDFKEKGSLVFENSKENKIFVKYNTDYSQKQNVISAWWYYLKSKYEIDSLFKKGTISLNHINEALARIEKKEINNLKVLDKETYVSWFLTLKNLIINTPLLLKYKTKKIPEAINRFRSIDFKNPKLRTSGLLKELIDTHYLLIKRSVQYKDSISVEMNKTKHFLNNLVDNIILLNELSDYLFNYLEKRSFHNSSEYLTVELLSQNGCYLNDELTNKLESYRKLKRGSISPDIIFSNTTKLSDIRSTKLIVFQALWCPKCKEDIFKLKDFYTTWKAKEVEEVFISLDTEVSDFEKKSQKNPWKTDCKFKGRGTKR